MHTYLVLGGYGEMGRVIVHDLFETSKGNIIVAGHDETKAKKFARLFKNKRVKAVAVDVTDTKGLATLMKTCNVVINSTQYAFNLHVMRACEMARKPYLDLGGLFHMTRKQLRLHKRWKEKRLLAILGCGSTPGITNVLASFGISKLDRATEIHIRFADYEPSEEEKTFTIPYSLPTIIEEFSKRDAFFTKGKMKFVPALTGREEEIFPLPIGKVTEYFTLHSELATFPSSFRKKGIRECSFKVSFDEDFITWVKKIMKQKKSRGSAKMSGEQKKLIHDLEYIRVRMRGVRKGKPVSLMLDCITESKAKWHALAGAVDTGVPPSIIAQMIANGKIHARGVLPPELCIDPEDFFKELKKRDIKIRITMEENL